MEPPDEATMTVGRRPMLVSRRAGRRWTDEQMNTMATSSQGAALTTMMTGTTTTMALELTEKKVQSIEEKAWDKKMESNTKTHTDTGAEMNSAQRKAAMNRNRNRRIVVMKALEI